ncbi:hypothetical protein PENCOP_c001G01092 [Penicillium coprophilum]|uniref:Uncharacterized protein n=1 Tax=Penicillium coprophilum TaxID=36646 RepID=A0A1V6V5U3_9EURO|nr:hypothetical protein PENCOP_c001G01092 [Penicillium coprophilum]
MRAIQRTQLSVEYDEAEEGGNSSTKFAGIDGLVEQFAPTIGQRCIGGVTANNQPLGQIVGYCARMGNQSAGETGRGEEIDPVGDINPGVKPSSKRSQVTPKTQISRHDNGVSKSRTRPSRVHNTGSNERIQAALNSKLAGTSKSPDQLDAVDLSTGFELDSVIKVDLDKD